MSRENNLKGAAREMATALDLMQRGFQVFRPLSTAACDLIALKHDLCLRIEVKGAHGHCKNPSGPVSTMECRGGNNPDCKLFDILVRHTDAGEMLYQRSVFHKINVASAELPLREEYSKNVSQKNLSRAARLEKT